MYPAASWTFANGVKVTFNYTNADYWDVPPQTTGCGTSTGQLLTSVSNSLGRSLTFSYTPTTVQVPNASYTGYGTVNLAYTLNSVTDENGNAVTFNRTCTAGEGILCDTFTATSAGATTTYQYAPTTSSPNPAVLMRPGYHMRSWTMPPVSAGSAQQTFIYDELFRVKSVTEQNGSPTTYLPGGLSSEPYRPGRKRDADGEALSAFDANNNLVLATDELGRTSHSVADGNNRNVRSMAPEGNEARKTYDLRGNVLTETSLPKPGSSLSQLAKSTTYLGGPTQMAWDCANMKICNKPDHVIDARGYRTNYTYCTPTNADCTIDTGQVRRITTGLDSNGNCTVAGGVCPLTVFSYSAFTGSDGATFYLLTSKTEQIDATHSTVTTYGYNTSNKFLLKEVVVDSGGKNLRTCLKFDAIGNLISKTEPNAGLGSCP